MPRSIGSRQPAAIGVPPPHELGLKSIEVPATHGVPNLVDQSYRPAFVMDGRQGVRKHLFGLEEMVDVSARIVGACIAVATVLQRAEISPEPRGIDVVTPIDGVNGGIAGYPGGVHTIEGVSSRATSREEVIGLRDAQQMTGTVLGKLLGTPRDDASQVHLLNRSPQTEAVEALTVNFHAC